MRQFVLAFLLFNAAGSQAAQYCITADTALYSALMTAASSPEADEIRFVRGTLDLNANLIPNVKIEGDLQLRGGYAAGCAARAHVAHNTRINGNGREIRLLLRQASDLLVERLNFVGLERFSVGDNVAEPPGPYGNILVTRSAFRDAAEGLAISALRHEMRIENSLFIDNGQGMNGSGLKVEGFFNTATQQNANITVVNCTAAGNSTGILVAQGSGGADAPAPVLVNNISVDTTFADLVLHRVTMVRFNIYRNMAVGPDGALHAESRQNLNVDPLLDTHYQPIASASPAINSGDNAVLRFQIDPQDYAGSARKIGVTIDRGAFESASGGGLGFP